jgi:3-dehydroquinate synthase
VKPGLWPVSDLLSAMRHDKKAVAGRLRLVLPRRLGAVELTDQAAEGDVARVLEEVSREPDPSP